MNFNEQFPILDNYTYLNTASSGIISQSMLDWRRNHDVDFFNKGSIFRNEKDKMILETKEAVARFFNAKRENTFLIPNFSFGFNTLLDKLPKSHRFLLLQDDYPSVNYPIQNRGFTHDYAMADEYLEENILEQINIFEPTVFAFSIVQYINGIKIDLEFVKKLKNSFPSLLIVADGTQFCGTEIFDFEDSGIDVLISSAYKWMLAGYGNGFICVKDEVINNLFGETGKLPLPKESFLKNKKLPSFYFEPGHQDTLAFGSLLQSVLFFEKAGFPLLEERIKKISAKAKSAFIERGLLDQKVAMRIDHSSIFNLNIDGNISKKFHSERIIFSERGTGVRVSFHFYNTENDLKHLLKIIDK